MALSSYNDLLVAIPKWAMRVGDTEFAGMVPDFIALAEDLMNNGTDDIPPIRTREMETDTTLTLVDGVASLPLDYLEARSIRYGSQNADLPFHDADFVGGEFRSSRNGISPLSLGYYAKIPALGPDNQTNWLILKNKQAYLYGALLVSSPFLMDDARLGTWGTLYAKAIVGLTNTDFRGKYSRAAVRTTGPTP